MHTYHNRAGGSKDRHVKKWIITSKRPSEQNHQGNICEEENAQIIHSGGGTCENGGEGHL